MSVASVTNTTLLPTLRRFEMQERDFDILEFFARVRYATADQAIRFAGGSEKNLGNRIRLMHAYDFIGRVNDREALVKLFHLIGNSSPVYGLAPAGRQLLMARRGVQPAKIRAKAPLIPHTVAATEFVLQTALAARTPNAPRLIHQSDLVLPEKTRALERPFRFRVPFQEDFQTLSLNVDPDILFSVLYPDNYQHNFCVEIDLKSETIAKRRNGKIVFAKSTFARKQKGFFLGRKEGRHREQWGWQGFRVLTLTTSEARIRSMLQSQEEVTNHSARDFFLYSTFDRVKRHSPFAPIWISAERDDVSIIERRE